MAEYYVVQISAGWKHSICRCTKRSEPLNLEEIEKREKELKPDEYLVEDILAVDKSDGEWIFLIKWAGTCFAFWGFFSFVC
jgi:hypothetical protein